MRMNALQMSVLRKYFKMKNFWSPLERMRIAIDIQMTPEQVRKWNWDERKRL